MTRDRTKTRRLRKREAARRVTEAALARRCPACGVKPGTWCGMTRMLGPWMHERRYRGGSAQ